MYTLRRVGHVVLRVLLAAGIAASPILFTACPQPVDSSILTIAEDKIAPTLNVTSPTDGSEYFASVTVSGTVTDSAFTAGDNKGSLKSLTFVIQDASAKDRTVTFTTSGTVASVTPADSSFSYDKASGAFSIVMVTSDLINSHQLVVTAVDMNGNQTQKTINLSQSTGPYINVTQLGTISNTVSATYQSGDDVQLIGTLANSAASRTSANQLSSLTWSVPGQTWRGSLDLKSGATDWNASAGLFQVSDAIGTYGSYLASSGTPSFTFNPTTLQFETDFIIPSGTNGAIQVVITSVDLNGHSTTVTEYMSNNQSGPQVKPGGITVSPSSFYTPSGYSTKTYTVEMAVGTNSSNISNIIVSAVSSETSGNVTTYAVGQSSSAFVPSYSSTGTSTNGAIFTFQINTGAVDGSGHQHTNNISVEIQIVGSNNITTLLVPSASYPALTITSDTTAPTISNLTFNGATSGDVYLSSSGNLSVAFDVSDNTGGSGLNTTSSPPTMTINGHAVTLSTSSSSAPYHYTGTYSPSANSDSEGVESFTITATDLAGNSGTTTQATAGVPIVSYYPGVPTLTNVAISSNISSYPQVAGPTSTATVTFKEQNNRTFDSTNTTVTIGTEVVHPTYNGTSQQYSATFTTLSSDGLTSDANIPFTISFQDMAGNSVSATQAAATSQLFYDATAPTVTVTPPTYSGASVSVPITTSDTGGSGVVSVTASVDGNPAITASGSGNSWSVAVTGLTQSVHHITATATDEAGNSFTSSSVAWTVDTTPPTIQNVKIGGSSTGSVYFGSSGVSVSFDVTDNSGGSGVDTTTNPPTMTINGHAVSLVAPTAITNGYTYTGTYTPSTDTEGAATFAINAKDRAGNSAIAITNASGGVPSVYYYPGNPTLTNVAISSNIGSYPQVAGPTSTATVTFKEQNNRVFNSANTTVTVGPEIVHPTYNGTSQQYSATFTTLSADGLTSDADIPFTISFQDMAGNSTSATQAAAATQLFYDATAPSATVTPPTYSGASVSVPITTSDTGGSGVVSVTASVDGGSAISATGSGNSWSVALTGLSQASHSITATATDEAGNSFTTSPAATWTVDTTAPTIQNVKIGGSSTGNVYFGSSSVSVSFDVTDNSGGSGVDTTTNPPTMTINGHAVTLGAPSAITNGYTYTGTYVPSTDTEGPITFAINAKDIAGNSATAVTNASAGVPSVYYYPGAPTLSGVQMTSSNGTNNAYANSTNSVTLSFSIVNSRVLAAVPTVTIAGQSVTPSPNSATGPNYAATATLSGGTGLTDGNPVPFTINFTDAAGNGGTPVTQATAGVTNVTYDNTAPSVGLTAVPFYSNSSSQTLTGTVTSGSTPTVTITVKHGTTTVSTGNATVVGSSWSYTTTLSARTYTVIASATDLAGNNTSTTFTNDFIVDTTAPTIQNVKIGGSSTGNVYFGSSSVSVSFDVTDNSGGSGVDTTTNPPTMTINGHAVTLGAPSAITNGYTYTGTYVPSTDTEGPITFAINAKDIAGNTATAVTNASAGVPSVYYYPGAPTLSGVQMTSSNGTNNAYANSTNSVTLTFSIVNNRVLSAAPTVTIAGQSVTPSPNTPNGGSYTATLSSLSGISGLSDGNPVPFTIGFTDAASTAGVPVTQATAGVTNVTYDNASPVLLSAQYKSVSTPGTVDTIVLTFSENVTYTSGGTWSITANGLTDGTTSLGNPTNVASTGNSVITLTGMSAPANVTGVGVGQLEPTISYTGSGIVDNAGNTSSAITNVTLADDAAGILVSATASAAASPLFTAGTDSLTLTFSEPVDSTVLTVANLISDVKLLYYNGSSYVATAPIPSSVTLSQSTDKTQIILQAPTNGVTGGPIISMGGANPDEVEITANTGLTGLESPALNIQTNGSSPVTGTGQLSIASTGGSHGIVNASPASPVTLLVSRHSATPAVQTVFPTPTVSLNAYNAISAPSDAPVSSTATQAQSAFSIATLRSASAPVSGSTLLPGLSRAPLAGESYGDFHASSATPIEQQIAREAGRKSAPQAQRTATTGDRPQVSASAQLAAVGKTTRSDSSPTSFAGKSATNGKQKAAERSDTIRHPSDLAGSILFIQILGGLLLLGLPLTRRRVRKHRK